MYQTRTCTPEGCTTTSRCCDDPAVCPGVLNCPVCISDGNTCSQDSERCSQNCVLDYDGTGKGGALGGKVCSPANQCWHNDSFYNINQDYGATTEYFICRSCSAGATARWVYNSAGRLIIKQKTGGATRMILDKAGNLLITGTLFQFSSPGSSGWQVKTSTGVKAQLDTSGNFYLKDSLPPEQQGQTAISPTANSEFLLKVKDQAIYPARIDTSGNMQIRGQLGVGCSL